MEKKDNNLNDILNEAFKNKDFSEINKIISSTVSSAIDITKSGINKVIQDYKSYNNKYIPVKDPKLVIQKLPLETKSILYRLIGACSFIIHSFIGIIFLFLLLFNNIIQSALLLDWIFPALLISAFVYIHGNSVKKKSIRFKRYLRELGDSTVITIAELASAVGEDEDDVIDDLKEFIQKDYLKEARLIENESIFILDKKTYEIYKNNNFEDLNKEDLIDDEIIKEEEEKSSEYLLQLKSIESNLTGDMKIKTNKLISLVEEIFEFSKKEPENETSTYKFMQYYLPTTIKLLNSYCEFSRIEVKGENIKSAMVDIQYSMDTIILAFSKFLDNLYENSTIDIQTDLSVLKTVMSQDGLLEEDFKIRK